jgi:hypothetical protein
MNDKKGHGVMTYTTIRSNEPLAMRIFQITGEDSSPGGWYVRLWMDNPDYDLLLTFGPMSHKRAQLLQDLLTKTSCDVREKWEPPFERDEEATRVQALPFIEEPWYEGEVEVELSGLAMMRQRRNIHLATRGMQEALEALAKETARDAAWSYQGMLDETIEVIILSPLRGLALHQNRKQTHPKAERQETGGMSAMPAFLISSPPRGPPS